jgi:hypothetical protein
MKLDEEWILVGNPKNHNEADEHRVLVAADAGHEWCFQCSCGYVWWKLKIVLKVVK